MKKQLLLTSAAFLAPTVALGQVQYGTDDISNSDNFLLDIGSGTSAGPVYDGLDTWASADDDVNGIYYVGGGVQLGTAPLAGGGAAVTVLGDIVNAGTTTTNSVLGFAYDGGVLYAYDTGAPDGLYTIDVVTLEATNIYVMLDSAFSAGGLDRDPATGLFYNSNDGAGYTDPNGNTGRGIATIDLAGMTEALIAPYPSGVSDVDGLAFDPNGSGSVYLLEDNPAPLHRYDLGAGAYDANPADNAILGTEVFSGGTYIGAGGGATIGTNYCAAVPNSTGVAAAISATGSTSAAANNVTLTASDMPSGQFGIFVTSQTQATTPLASGILCVGGTIIRFQDPGQILMVDAGGEFSLQIDTTALPGLLPTPINAGETWNFTAWFRDADPTGNTANFTNGVSIAFN